MGDISRKFHIPVESVISQLTEDDIEFFDSQSMQMLPPIAGPCSSQAIAEYPSRAVNQASDTETTSIRVKLEILGAVLGVALCWSLASSAVSIDVYMNGGAESSVDGASRAVSGTKEGLKEHSLPDAYNY